MARFCQHSRIPLHLLLMFTSQTPELLRKLVESQRKLSKRFTNSETTTHSRNFTTEIEVSFSTV